MSLIPQFNGSIDHHLSQASRHLARAAEALRDKGDHEFAVIIQSCLHGLERPHWLPSSDSED